MISGFSGRPACYEPTWQDRQEEEAERLAAEAAEAGEQSLPACWIEPPKGGGYIPPAASEPADDGDFYAPACYEEPPNWGRILRQQNASRELMPWD